MMNVDFAQVWKKTTDFMRAESHLVAPVALATIALGQAGFLIGSTSAGGQPQGLLLLVMFACLFLVMLGWLAISALVLKPGISVGEAMTLGLKRLPRLIVIYLWFLLALFLLSVPLVLLLAKSGLNMTSGKLALQPGDVLILAPLLIFAIWLSVRSYLLNATVLDEEKPALPSLARSWALTRGGAARLLPILMVFFIVAQLVQLVAALVATLIFTPVMAAIGAPDVAPLLVALVSGIAGAGPAALATVFAAMLYKEIRDQLA